MILLWVFLCLTHSEINYPVSKQKQVHPHFSQTVVKNWVFEKQATIAQICLNYIALTEWSLCIHMHLGTHPDISILLIVSSAPGQFCTSKHHIIFDLEVNMNDLPSEVWFVVSEWYIFRTGTSQMTAKFTAILHFRVDWHFHKLYKHIPCSAMSLVNV